MADHSWVLSAVVVLPLLGSPLAVLLAGSRLVPAWLGPALLEVTVLLSLWLVSLLAGGRTIDLPVATAEIVGLEFSLRLAADRLSAAFLVLVTTVGLATAVFHAGETDAAGNARSRQPVLLLSIGVVAGVLASGNLLTLYAFWQLAVLCLTLAILAGLRGRSLTPALRFFLTGELAALLLLFALGLAYAGGETDFSTGWLIGGHSAARLATSGLLIAAGLVAVAASPLQRGFTLAGTAAHPSVAPFLFGIQNKAGLYVLARTVTLALPDGTPAEMASLLAIIGALTVVVAGLAAIAQAEARALVASLAVGQTGAILLGFGSGEQIGLAGALFLTVGQTLALVLVLLALELVHSRAGGELPTLGGLARELPLAAVAFAVGALSLVGVPPWTGFVGQMLVYQGLAASGEDWWVVLVAAGVAGSLLATAALARFGGRVFLGERSPQVSLRPADLSTQTSVAGLTLVVATLGLLPRLVLDPLVSPVVGLAFAGGLANLAVVPAPGYPAVSLWSPLLSSVLLVLPLAVAALGRAPRRRRTLVVPAGKAAAVAALAKQLSPGNDVVLPAHAAPLLIARWWQAAQAWTAAGNLDPLLLGYRLLMPVARLAAASLHVALRLLLR